MAYYVCIYFLVKYFFVVSLSFSDLNFVKYSYMWIETIFYEVMKTVSSWFLVCSFADCGSDSTISGLILH